MRRLSNWFTKSPVRFFLLATILAVLIIVPLDIFVFGTFDLSEISNILVEAHGLLFDLMVFGIILTGYEEVKRKKEEKERVGLDRQKRIERYEEELNDYRGWYEPEAAYRVAGIIKRLGKEGVNEINYENLILSKCPLELIEELAAKKFKFGSLKEAVLDEGNLAGADFDYVNLEGSSFINTNLQEANFTGSKLKGANLWKANLKDATFRYRKKSGLILLGSIATPKEYFGQADLEGANLSKADLQGVILTAANLKNAKLIDANLQRAKLDLANLEGANLFNTDFRNANLRDAEIQNARIFLTDFRGADLTYATFERSDISTLKLKGAKLKDEDWKKWFSNVQKITSKYYLSDPKENGDCIILEKSPENIEKDDKRF